MAVANLLYRQTLLLSSGDVKGLVVSTLAQSELSTARQTALRSQMTTATIYCAEGAFRVATVTPGDADPLVEEGDTLDITTQAEAVDCRMKGVRDGRMTIAYYGGGNAI